MKSICVIVPDIDGGTLRHAKEMAEAWSKETTVLYIRYIGRVYNVAIMHNSKIVRDAVIFIGGELNILSSLLNQYNVKLIHIHHFLYMKDKLMNFYRNLSIPYMITLHDYYTICPRVQLLSGGIYCDIPDIATCNRCLNNGDRFINGIFPFNVKDITDWRDYWWSFLNGAESIFCPSDDQRMRILRVFPQLSDRLFMVENPEIIVPEYIPMPDVDRKNDFNELRIGVIGTINRIKGRDVILTCAEFAKSQSKSVKFVVFGTLDGVNRRYIPSNVEVLGRYKEQDIYQMIVDNSVNYFWFPAIWPETYSYVLTIPIRMGIPVLAWDIGAIAERIAKHGWGDVYPLTSETDAILNYLMNFNYQRYAATGDFTVHNNKFPSINFFYQRNILDRGTTGMIELPSMDNTVFDAHINVYGEMRNLNWEEYKMLIKADKGEIGRLRLTAALDKREFVSRGIGKVIRTTKALFGKKI